MDMNTITMDMQLKYFTDKFYKPFILYLYGVPLRFIDFMRFLNYSLACFLCLLGFLNILTPGFVFGLPPSTVTSFLAIFLPIPTISTIILLSPFGSERFRDGLTLFSAVTFLSALSNFIIYHPANFITYNTFLGALFFWAGISWLLTVVLPCLLLRFYGFRLTSALTLMVSTILEPLGIEFMYLEGKMHPVSVIAKAYLPFGLFLSLPTIPLAVSLYKSNKRDELAMAILLSWLFYFYFISWAYRT